MPEPLPPEPPPVLETATDTRAELALPPDLILKLYDLLREHPLFVTWYLRTRERACDRWYHALPPTGALWARFGVAIIAAVVISLTGLGMAVSAPLGAWMIWQNHCDQLAYKSWRRQVDALIVLCGDANSRALMERVPQLTTFRQFLDYATGAASTGHKAMRSGRHFRE